MTHTTINEYGILIDTKKEEREAKKLARQEAKKAAKEVARIEVEKNQKEVSDINMSIEWRKSRMWGHNPYCTAEVRFKDGSFERSEVFTASGCGYDKESTVVADVFNTYLLYKLHNKPIEDRAKPYGIYLRSDWKNYNGGVGMSCYYPISEYIGGKLEHIANGKTFDVYKYTDK